MRSVMLCLLPLVACNPSAPDNDLGDVGPIGGDRAGGDSGGGDPNGGDPITITSLGVCGNNQVDGMELCDGTAYFAARDCSEYLAGAGIVRCNPDCTVDLTPCSDDPCTLMGWYGDAEGLCDACQLLGGTSDPDCADNCGADGLCANQHDFVVDAWTCVVAGYDRDPDCSVCGNGVAETTRPTGEYCDGNDLDSKSCSNFSYDGGTLACNSDCTFNFAGCTFVNGGPVCGNSSLEGYEECDPPQTHPCSDVGAGTGTLVCTSSCVLDVSGCSISDICQTQGWYNNGSCEPCPLLGGTRDPDCDGCAADGNCVDTYSPNADAWGCRHDGNADPDCGTCGNNVGEEREHCDGSDVRGQDCTDWRFSAGVLTCNPDCTLNFSRCTP